MIESMHKIIGGLRLGPLRMESISQNMANAGMPGYRGQHMTVTSFSGALDESISQFAPTSASVAPGEVINDFTPGALKRTNRSLDFALQSDGFFVVERGNGTPAYTRNGNFRLTNEGKLINQDGMTVRGATGDIKFAQEDNVDNIKVKPDGTIYSIANGTAREVGKLQIVEVSDLSRLRRIGSTIFEIDGIDEQLTNEMGAPKVYNHNLETANVSPIMEMTKLIETVRHFEFSQKVLSSMDENFKKHQQLLR